MDDNIDLDFFAFCVSKETTRMTANDLDEDGAERPRLRRAVMDRRSRPGPEPTTLEAVGDQWRYALIVVQAGDDDDQHITGHFGDESFQSITCTGTNNLHPMRSNSKADTDIQ